MEGLGAKASRLPLRIKSVFFESLPIAADASGAYRPNPQAPTKLVPGHPGLNGYVAFEINLDKVFWGILS